MFTVLVWMYWLFAVFLEKREYLLLESIMVIQIEVQIQLNSEKYFLEPILDFQCFGN